MRPAFNTTSASIIGTEIAMASAPDGYMMLFGYNQLATLNRLLFRRLPCDPDRMTRVGLVSDAPLVMLVPKDLPATTVAEFLALAKRRPGAPALGTSGPDTFAHFNGEILMREAGIQLLHVPHRTTPRNKLMAAQVQLCFVPTARHRAGKRGSRACRSCRRRSPAS
jgi:tripartite-type tricarboxylate transporter receptor subunit TctC